MKTIRFVQGKFVDRYDPTIEDSYQKSLDLKLDEKEEETRRCNLEILDTAGTDQFAAMRELYLRDGDGFALVYSVTSAASFHELNDIYEQLIKNREEPSVF